jgi:hypothetical protein
MIAHRLLFFALPALVLLVMQLNIPWHMLLGGDDGDNAETYTDKKKQKKQKRSTTSLEGFKDDNDSDSDKDSDNDNNDSDNDNNDSASRKVRGSQRCLVAFDGPSTMTSNEDIDRIPEESERMRNAVRAYQKRCRRQNEWASDLIQKRKMEELALVCEQKRREDKRGEQIYRS